MVKGFFTCPLSAWWLVGSPIVSGFYGSGWKSSQFVRDGIAIGPEGITTALLGFGLSVIYGVPGYGSVVYAV